MVKKQTKKHHEGSPNKYFLKHFLKFNFEGFYTNFSTPEVNIVLLCFLYKTSNLVSKCPMHA